MDLPINDKELNTIINAMTLGGDTALYQKLKLALRYGPDSYGRQQ